MSTPENTPSDNTDIVALTIDIGGSHVKIMTSSAAEERKADSGPTMTADEMVRLVKELAKGWHYDVISMGFPGPIADNKPLQEPAHLGTGWAGHDFAASFGQPVKLVNDALMQAVGSYQGGRMLFLGLGTGLGSAMIVQNVAQPLELGHLPYKKGQNFEYYVGELALERRGKKKWRKSVFDVVERLHAAMLPDYIVIGGGNVEKLDELPEHCIRGDNLHAFTGGFRIWHDKALAI